MEKNHNIRERGRPLILLLALLENQTKGPLKKINYQLKNYIPYTGPKLLTMITKLSFLPRNQDGLQA